MSFGTTCKTADENHINVQQSKFLYVLCETSQISELASHTEVPHSPIQESDNVSDRMASWVVAVQTPESIVMNCCWLLRGGRRDSQPRCDARQAGGSNGEEAALLDGATAWSRCRCFDR